MPPRTWPPGCRHWVPSSEKALDFSLPNAFGWQVRLAVEQKGYDAGKKVSGIKRHIAVDTQALVAKGTCATKCFILIWPLRRSLDLCDLRGHPIRSSRGLDSLLFGGTRVPSVNFRTLYGDPR